MSQFKKFILTYLGTVAGIVGVVAGINWRIDPFVFFGNNTLGAYAFSEREFKYSRIKSSPHNALIIGSSTGTFIDPSDFEDYQFFNASISGGLIEEIHYFLHNIPLEDIELVILDINLFTINEGFYPIKEQPEQSYPVKKISFNSLERIMANTISWEMLNQSATTVYKHYHQEEPKILEDGQLNPLEKRQDEKEFLQYSKEKQQEIYRKQVDILISQLEDFDYPSRRMQMLTEIQELLEDKDIPIIVFASPINYRVIEEFKDMENYDAYLQMKEDLQQIFPNFVDLSESKYSQDKYFFAHDIVHYSPQTAKKMINEVLQDYQATN